MEQPGDRIPAPGSLAVVQDFVNTADLEGGTDLLGDIGQVAAFCADHDVAVTGLTESDVTTCRDLREALRAACRAHTGIAVTPKAEKSLTELLTLGPLTLRIDVEGASTLAPTPGLSGAASLVAAMAAAVAAAATDGTWLRLKACEAHQCQWVYYDRSPAARSRWCTMSICGSRAKMRAYRGKAR